MQSCFSDRGAACGNETLRTPYYTGCFEKSFTTLKVYIDLVRGHVQGFELSRCSKIHRVLSRTVAVQYDFQW
jgi:hypothetical protein